MGRRPRRDRPDDGNASFARVIAQTPQLWAGAIADLALLFG